MRGKGLFLFAMLVALGNLRFASTPRCRSLPAFYSMTIVGAGGLSTRVGNAMMRLREGTGRKFGNMILTNISTHPGIRIETCTQSSTDTPSALPTMSLNTYLFFTSKNIIESPTAGFSIMSPRTDTVPSICSNECFYTSNAARDNGAPGCECDLHRALFIFDAFSTAPTFATRASSDQVECKLNVFAEHTSASPPSPELDALNPYMSPEPKLMATEPDSPYMPYNPAVMRRHQGNFSLAHTEKRSYWYRELDNGMKKLFGSNLSATTNTSFSASVKVPTGSYSELKEYPAIAQDMLFPSDATCPKEDECETFLTSVGGGSNAFVDKIHKDFFFEMVSSNVVPVLERLVAFFIAPTFVTRASSLDQINREFNKFGKHLTNATALSNTSILLSPEILDVMNPDVSPEPNLVATKPNSQGPVSERLCEHMLFPSNAKCPKEDEYETFLTSVGGGSNAFMDKIHKDFFFRVVSSKVVPVLERLVAFFIAPTFVTRASSLDPVNRERNVLAEPVANTPASQSPDAMATAVSTSAGLTSALANTAVGRIVLAPGTYFLNAELTVTRSVVIEAEVAGSVVLDAQASSSSRRRVLYINPGSLGVVQLIGLNITRGYVQGGGGVYVYSGTVTITSSSIYGNTADYGGGVYVSYGTVTITSSSIYGNRAGYGGGVYVSSYSGTVTITSSSISGNRAQNQDVRASE
ncbi:insulin-degrading enzyme [Chrysochromulina tobinii]|uniref:Insulin-degrading enzyme n=1 Tax=Chrysochromulina tobinii TaxID=1460289 RepID=A0A0M0JFW3_9EUKA|nr:insulin-degrading enzyme [Chrysochromulina tobinii]|eukprot:KOO25133.1 insulin-degrading enzyme [Chrysochromulina sp. CCMP291]